MDRVAVAVVSNQNAPFRGVFCVAAMEHDVRPAGNVDIDLIFLEAWRRAPRQAVNAVREHIRLIFQGVGEKIVIQVNTAAYRAVFWKLSFYLDNHFIT